MATNSYQAAGVQISNLKPPTELQPIGTIDKCRRANQTKSCAIDPRFRKTMARPRVQFVDAYTGAKRSNPNKNPKQKSIARDLNTLHEALETGSSTSLIGGEQPLKVALVDSQSTDSIQLSQALQGVPLPHCTEELDALRDFIASLDADWDRAGQAYESMRQNLISYFRRRRCFNPEDLADETIDRTARKHKQARNLQQFVLGIARRVASEHFRAIKPVSFDRTLEADCECASETSNDHDRIVELERALQSLSPRNREMVVAYYQFEGGVRIRNRQRLAAALNVSLETLAVRVLRVRRMLRKYWREVSVTAVT